MSLYRPGRGYYGISNEEILQKLDASKNGCLFEESPQNIIQLFRSETLDNMDNKIDKTLLYILPPNPIIETAISRLQNRLNAETDPEKRVLTPENFESTIGDRQIDEFLELKSLIDNPDIKPLFIINEGDPEQVAQNIIKILQN